MARLSYEKAFQAFGRDYGTPLFLGLGEPLRKFRKMECLGTLFSELAVDYFLLTSQAEEGPEKKVSAFFKILPVDHLFR